MLLERMRLNNIGPFRGLGVVARRLNIPLTLFGGTASRAAIRMVQRPRLPLDLFDLAPFGSDIDLEYDAGPDEGPVVMASIQENVPFASWFRWSLVDRERAILASAQREVSTIVPLRSIRYSTNCAPTISEEALMDLHTGKVRFTRNLDFDPGVGLKRDVELFGLMMALNAEADFQAIDAKAPGLDRDAALSWLSDSAKDDLIRIVHDGQLLARFWALFATRWSLAGSQGIVFERLTQMASETGIFKKLNFDPTNEKSPVSLSRPDSFGNFRVPELSPRVVLGNQTRDEFAKVMLELTKQDILSSDFLYRFRSPEEAIDPSLKLVAIVPRISIMRHQGEIISNPDVFQSGLAFDSRLQDEFIQISWMHQGPVPKSGFTAQLLPFGQSRDMPNFSSVPAVGGVQGARAWIRVRLDDLADKDTKKTSTDAALIILQARNA